jgi:hypothetical protein
MIKKKIKKNQKPIKVEAQLVYRCPDNNCGLNHWINLNAAKVKNFKVVCDCGCVFQPKTIKTIKILYKKSKTKKPIQKQNNTIDTVVEEHEYETYTPEYQNDLDTKPEIEKQEKVVQKIPEEILEKGSSVLVGYGFTKQESEKMLERAYSIDPTKDLINLIKLALTKLEK